MSGLTPREQAILDQADAGAHPDAIATDLGLAPTYVGKIIKMYSVEASDRHADGRSRRGSERLLAAIARHHPECVAGAVS